MEAGQLMSETLPPKINLHEGRERKGEEGGEGGGRERGFQRGQKGKSLRFNGIKTAQFLQGLPALIAVDHSSLGN